MNEHAFRSEQTEKSLRCNDGITSMIHILSHFARAKTHLPVETMLLLCALVLSMTQTHMYNV